MWLPEIFAAFVGAMAKETRRAMGIGPSRREIERECDANGWDYSPVHMAQARAQILQRGD